MEARRRKPRLISVWNRLGQFEPWISIFLIESSILVLWKLDQQVITSWPRPATILMFVYHTVLMDHYIRQTLFFPVQHVLHPSLKRAESISSAWPFGLRSLFLRLFSSFNEFFRLFQIFRPNFELSTIPNSNLKPSWRDITAKSDLSRTTVSKVNSVLIDWLSWTLNWAISANWSRKYSHCKKYSSFTLIRHLL